MADVPGGENIRVAYVVSRYPATTHTFIYSEIAALRRLGVEVHTISLRASHAADIRTPSDREEFARTRSILPVAAPELVVAFLRAFVFSPRRLLRTLVFALLGAHGSGERLRRLAHFGQALMVWSHCVDMDLAYLHAHFERPAADVAMLAAMLGGGEANGWNWSFTAHSPTQYLGDAGNLARKVRQAKFVACVSHFGRSQLMALVDDEHWSKLYVVRCGVDTAVFRAPPALEGANGSILTVGRLERAKGHAVLLHALDRLRKAGHRLQAVWVGDGFQMVPLERLVKDLDLSSVVQFVGSVGQDAIRGYYASAEVFCLPSFVEGVPVVLMEAMAMGLPVVAPWIGGIPELIEDGKSGRLVRPGSPDALAAALSEILSASPQERAEMGMAGRARVEQEFRCDRSAETLRRLFVSQPESPSQGAPGPPT